jgi:hypothetical protein
MIEAVQQLLAAENARAQLRKIPGVIAIGYGLKEKNGEYLHDIVFRVYVEKKKPAAELKAEEIIPKTVGEFRTDVVEWFVDDVGPLCCCKAKPLRPGAQIARYMSDTPGVDSPDNIGTLGCFVRRNGVNYLLSNEHVIMGMIPYASDEIYRDKKDRTCNSRCNEPISHMQSNPPGNSVPAAQLFAFRDVRLVAGMPQNLITFTRVGHHAAQVDCAIGRLEPAVLFTNQTEQYGAIDPAIRDITGGVFSASPPNNPPVFSTTTPLPLPADVAVQKVGRTTQHTQGEIIEVARELHNTTTGEWVVIWEIYVTPTGEDNVDFEVSVDESSVSTIPDVLSEMATTPVRATAVGARGIRFQGKAFGRAGDSGSVVVDSNKKVIGLLWGGRRGPLIRITSEVDGQYEWHPPKGIAAVTPIAAVFFKLGLDPDNAIIPASAPTAGALIPGAELIPQEQAGSRMHHRTQQLSRLLENSPLNPGGDTDALFTEVGRLVNHERRCMVAWQRNKGPAFVSATLSALGDENAVFKKTVAGITLEKLLAEMRVALCAAGSPELKAFLDQAGDNIIRIAQDCENFDQLIAALSSNKINTLTT